MQNFGKRTMVDSGEIATRSSGTCFKGCIVTCKGLCGCTKLNTGAAAADGTGGGKNTTVWGRNYVNLSGD